MKVIAVGREEDPASVREAAPGKQWQEALRANGRGERAAVRLRSGARGCRREAGKVGEGSVLELRGAPAAAAAAAAAAKRPCCVVCGAGGGGGGSKAERGDGRDTTHGTRWPERQQHRELSDVLPRPRCPLAGGELYSGGPEARRSWVAVAEARGASHGCRSSWPRRPGLPGPRRLKLGCGSGRGGAPGPGRLDRAWAGGSGGWSVPVSKMETRRCQWPSYTRLLTEFKINLLMA
uniref:uncharacterized protein LOC120886252 n=1 Tax=Ictidomys tridecemlineatus TaxID=43179 RepID=UPI00038C3DB8|nr:uncharacterized protein LOC120886252 [Ictidomys tridecemlineatus]XP_040130423.1 uncharacterized protein LOC120886252 [Ictidomys tridecemlineatus]XP_040130424.1 uncharacterized protein LOC120886252 [Ictidomys tridecemlineatus]